MQSLAFFLNGLCLNLCQNHPKFECLPPRPESGVPEPEDDLTPDAEKEDIEPTIADSDTEEDEEAEADEEEAPKKQKFAADLDEGATSSFAAPSEQPKMVEPLATRAPIPEADERAAKKKKPPVYAAITSSG